MQTYKPNLSLVSRFELDEIIIVVTQQTVIIIRENRYLILSRIIS
ncbi:MAG TPA: hypothetical protein VD947_02765 [Patescibacteria group bacterium]|nr:hypothetical protein [Patescibacteria group bacterium]